MSRRKPMAVRLAGGRINSKAGPKPTSPVEIRRLRDASMAGMRAPEWSSQLGLLFLNERISSLQYSAGRHWITLAANYRVACDAPRQPRTAPLDPIGGQSPDIDSTIGRKQARRHEQASRAFVDAKHALKTAGHYVENVVESVVERDQAPACWAELEALRQGLQALAAQFSDQRKVAGRR